MTKTETTPKLYVGTYKKYNEGSISGKWLELENYSDKEEFLEACAELHNDEEDPEFMFQDFEGFPRSLYSESGIDSELWDWINLDDYEKKVVEMYIEATGEDMKQALEDAMDRFVGSYASGADYAQETFEECYSVEVPTWVCIDWYRTWENNLRYDYYYEESEDGELYIFNAC